MRITMLDIPIDDVTRAEAKARISTMLDGDVGRLVTTPNPEMLVAATKDASFRRVLQGADLAVADGIGLVLVSRVFGPRLPERVAGVDLVRDVAEIAATRGRGVYLLGGEPGVAKDAADVLRARYPTLRVVGAEDGGDVAIDSSGAPRVADAVLARIRSAAPDVLLVAFGHGTQEKWLAANLRGLPSVRVGMGIGGSFDFISGKVRRAPAFVRRIGFEWLWRLIRQPWRLRRILTAVLVFPYLVIRHRIAKLRA